MNTNSRLVMKLAATCALTIAACGGDKGAGSFITGSQETAGTVAQQPAMGGGGAGGTMAAGVPRAFAQFAPLAAATPMAAAGSGGSAAAGSGTAGATGVAGMAAAAGSSGASAGAGGAGGSGGAKAGSGGAGGASAMGGRGGNGSGGHGGASATGGRGGSGGMGGSVAAAGGAGAGGAAAGAGGAMAGSAGSAGSSMSASAGGHPALAMITGTATFTTSSSGVDLTVMVTGCVADKKYPIHIHAGTSCDSAMTQMGHWGPERGESIPPIVCGAGGVGTTTTSRSKTGDPKLVWTLGDGSDTDVIGHVMVIHDADDGTIRIACGKVTK